MTNYSQHTSTRKTPQTQKAKPIQKRNNAGGFTFVIDKWAQLNRFLILGADGGTYYVSEKKLTQENAKVVLACLAEDGPGTVKRIVDISKAGRAPKNDPAIFALALAASDPKLETRHAALAALPDVCRIGTHLFHFVRDLKEFRGWSRMLRRAIADWYTRRPEDKLANQLLKYQQRDGWGHRDLIRLAHVHPKSFSQNAAFRWAVGAELGDRKVKRGKGKDAPMVEYKMELAIIHPMLAAYEQLKKSTPEECVKLIGQHKFTHEMIPSEHKNLVEVWEALLEDMPMTALIRNLNKMTSLGMFKPMGANTKKVMAMLSDAAKLKDQRVHPIAVLTAMKIYGQGKGEKGKLTWVPSADIVGALDKAFYLAFGAVEPTGKNRMLCMDISGSMHGSQIAGSPLSAAEASIAMAMLIARTEKPGSYHFMGFGGHFHPLKITPEMRLDDALEYIRGMNFGTTDCSLPMLYAAKEKIEVDSFEVFTDSETYAGSMHPFQALKQYRTQMNRPWAKEIVVATSATECSIADPSDPGSMDVVGFDAATPNVMSEFIRGGF